MQTEEEAKAVGERVREILLQLAMAHEKAVRKLDGTDLQQSQVEFIDGIIDHVHKELRPRYADRKILVYQDGRSIRSFQVEHQRLWSRALGLYVDVCCTSDPQIEELLRPPTNAAIHGEFKSLLCNQLESLIVPILDKHDTPGDDFYLYINELMLSAGSKVTIETIAETGKTPPEVMAAFCGIFGLLIQANREAQQGDITRGYTFLIDANHMIGMHEGARYAMKHLPEVAAKRRAKINSMKSRAEKDKIKMRALELFYSLCKTDSDGRRKLWASGNAAFEDVWDALVQEAKVTGKNKPGISESTVLGLCQMLQKRDIEGSSLDIRVEVVQLLPDGTEIKIPLS